MTFTTGAALLDAVVLAVVSVRERTATKLRKMCEPSSTYRKVRCIRYSGGCKKTIVLTPTTANLPAETDGTTA